MAAVAGRLRSLLGDSVRIWHAGLIIVILLIIGLYYETKQIMDADVVCRTNNGVSLKDMNGRYFCVIDGKLIPMKQLEKRS